MDTIEVSCLRSPISPEDREAAKEKKEGSGRDWRPGKEVFSGENGVGGTSLGLYESSLGVLRGFCSICGTNLSFYSKATPKKMDLFYGTLDKKFLDSEDGRPERHMWLREGIGWVKQWVEGGDPLEGGAEGKGRPGERHETDDVNDRVGPRKRQNASGDSGGGRSDEVIEEVAGGL